jgi:EpsI family protein
MDNRRFVVTVIVLLLGLWGLFLFGFRPVAQVVSTNLERLPLIIDDYRGEEDAFSDAVYEELNADKNIYRHYTDSLGKKVNLYIGYYGTAKGGRTSHNPYACLPSAGWAILDAHQVAIGDSRVNYILAKQGDVYETILHWYQSDGDKILTTGIQQNLQRFWGRIVHNRSDGAFVRVTTSVAAADIESGRQEIEAFAEMVIPLLGEYWPEER